MTTCRWRVQNLEHGMSFVQTCIQGLHRCRVVPPERPSSKVFLMSDSALILSVRLSMISDSALTLSLHLYIISDSALTLFTPLYHL